MQIWLHHVLQGLLVTCRLFKACSFEFQLLSLPLYSMHAPSGQRKDIAMSSAQAFIQPHICLQETAPRPMLSPNRQGWSSVFSNLPNPPSAFRGRQLPST